MGCGGGAVVECVVGCYADGGIGRADMALCGECEGQGIVGAGGVWGSIFGGCEVRSLVETASRLDADLFVACCISYWLFQGSEIGNSLSCAIRSRRNTSFWVKRMRERKPRTKDILILAEEMIPMVSLSGMNFGKTNRSFFPYDTSLSLLPLIQDAHC